MSDTNIIIRAEDFACRVHAGLVRKTTISGIERPQTIHLQEVADLVWASGGSDEEIAAAWLHDSVEDTPTTISDIEANFGKEITGIVFGLTDPKDFAGLPTVERKKKQSERVRTESLSVRRIKLADQTSNIRFIATEPPERWSIENRKDYTMGAKSIVDQCRGISPLLEKLFDDEYAKAMQRYGI